jgi:hypothetical protein
VGHGLQSPDHCEISRLREIGSRWGGGGGLCKERPAGGGSGWLEVVEGGSGWLGVARDGWGWLGEQRVREQKESRE